MVEPPYVWLVDIVSLQAAKLREEAGDSQASGHEARTEKGLTWIEMIEMISVSESSLDGLDGESLWL